MNVDRLQLLYTSSRNLFKNYLHNRIQSLISLLIVYVKHNIWMVDVKA
jgi:hypothetical protein